MLNEDQLADIETRALAFLAQYGIRDDRPIDVELLALRATGCRVREVSQQEEAKLRHVNGLPVLQARPGLKATRARWLAGHELGELYLLRTGLVVEDKEEWCDAFGASVVAPRRLVLALIEEHGHSVYTISHEAGVTQSVALLRIGELTGRPVALLRGGFSPTLIRGDFYAWPDAAGMLALARGADRSIAHPVKIVDEPAKVGLMVPRQTWRAARAG
jgi:hypothetical protein